MNFTAFDTIGACLASGGRHPQRGQGTCPIEPDPTNEPTAMLIPGRYDRTVFGGWSDEDGDCQNTRHERLIERSLEPVELTDTAVSPRQGAGTIRIRARAYTAASDLEIDHVVPLF